MSDSAHHHSRCYYSIAPVMICMCLCCSLLSHTSLSLLYSSSISPTCSSTTLYTLLLWWSSEQHRCRLSVHFSLAVDYAVCSGLRSASSSPVIAASALRELRRVNRLLNKFAEEYGHYEIDFEASDLSQTTSSDAAAVSCINAALSFVHLMQHDVEQRFRIGLLDSDEKPLKSAPGTL